MSLAQRALRVLFSFNGFLLLAFGLFRLRMLLDAGAAAWLTYVTLGLGVVSLLWVLHRENRVPSPEPAPVAAHVVWLLSAGGYVWTANDPSLTFVGDVWPDFSTSTMRTLERASLVKLTWISIYLLLSTTGLAALIRGVARGRIDSSAAHRRAILDVTLIVSVAALLVAILLAWVKPASSAPVIASLSFIVALLLASTAVAKGNKLAFGVGVAEVLSVTLVAAVLH